VDVVGIMGGVTMVVASYLLNLGYTNGGLLSKPSLIGLILLAVGGVGFFFDITSDIKIMMSARKRRPS